MMSQPTPGGGTINQPTWLLVNVTKEKKPFCGARVDSGQGNAKIINTNRHSWQSDHVG